MQKWNIRSGLKSIVEKGQIYHVSRENIIYKNAHPNTILKKKRSQKITTKYLGRITEEGLIAPKRKNGVSIDNVSVKEYGASEAVSQLGKNVHQALRKYFPNEADKIFAIAILRLIERCPFKRISEAYAN